MGLAGCAPKIIGLSYLTLLISQERLESFLSFPLSYLTLLISQELEDGLRVVDQAPRERREPHLRGDVTPF